MAEVIDEKKNLTEIQESIIENAKEELVNNGYLSPFAILPAVSTGKGQFQDVPAGEKTIAFNPLGELMGGNIELMITKLVHLAYDQPQQVLSVVSQLIDRVPADVENPQEVVLNTMLDQMGLHQKDIVAMHLADLIQNIGAYAIITVHEAWMKTGVEKPEQQGSLEHDPDAEECLLITLETKGWQRMMRIPFIRVGEGEDETFEFLDPIVLDSDDEDSRVTGRFFGFFEDPEAVEENLEGSEEETETSDTEDDAETEQEESV